MKRFVAITLAVMMILAFSVSVFGYYSEAEGYTTEVENYDYYQKFQGQGIEIDVYNWGEYVANDSVNFLDVNEDFEKLTGIKVNYTLFSSNEELYTKLRSGGANYDVIVPSDYMIGKMIGEGMLQKLNFDNIPNYKYIDEKYKNTNFDPNNEYSVPMYWGVVGIIYNTTMVDEEDLTGWNILWNEKYADNMLMFSNSRDAFALSLLDLGYDFNTTSETEIEEAAGHLRAQKPLVQAYVMDEIYDKMEGGEAALAPYYNGDAVLMMDVNEDLDFFLPENTSIFIDSMCIPNGAKNKEAAEMYINYMCESTVAAANSYYVGYSTPHMGAMELLDEELVENEIAYPDGEFIASLDALLTLPAETSTLTDRLWTDIMAQGSDSVVFQAAFLVGVVIIYIIFKLVNNRIKKKRMS
ncbi:MAG: ABC transporter substrate-binding protein, partial [Oscillospiraceae bacterium]|nr:ABC transporter substrate-binding protein [Oscillospiraceae bacterium]